MISGLYNMLIIYDDIWGYMWIIYGNICEVYL